MNKAKTNRKRTSGKRRRYRRWKKEEYEKWVNSEEGKTEEKRT